MRSAFISYSLKDEAKVIPYENQLRNCPEIISLFCATGEWVKIAPRNANQHTG